MPQQNRPIRGSGMVFVFDEHVPRDSSIHKNTYMIPIMENQMEKKMEKMENEMETGVIEGLSRDPSIQKISTRAPKSVNITYTI